MKNSKRILAVLLTMVMVVGCMASFTFTSAAESKNLTEYAKITMGTGGDVTTLLTDGDAGNYCDLGYWSETHQGTPFGTAGTCYIEIDLKTLCVVETVWAANLSNRDYRWDAYFTDDNTKAIGEWTKVDGKTNSDMCTSEGYTLTLDTPVTAQYIRLYGMYHSDNIGYHFTEVKVTGSWVDPNANLTSNVPKDPETTETIAVWKAFGGIENYGGKTFVLPNIQSSNNAYVFKNLQNGEFTMKLTFTDTSTGETYIIPEYFFDTPNLEFYPNSFFRFAICEYGIPATAESAFHVQIDIFRGEKLLYTGKTENAIASTQSDNFLVNGPIVPEEVPHESYKPGEEPVPPTEPTISEVAIKPYASGAINGFENWPASDMQTNMLIRAAKSAGDFRNNTWVLTINGEEYTMTVASVGSISEDYIYRFQVCLAEDQFIPVVGTQYVVSAEIYDGETLLATTTEATFVPHQDPIVPAAPEPPVEPTKPTEFTISPFDPEGLKGFENWDGGNGVQTQLLIATSTNVPEGYTWKLTIQKDSTGETKTISLVCSTAYDTWLRRFEPCLGEGENQFVPEVGEYYTISAEIYNEAGELVMIAGEADGFYNAFEPIVPEVEEPNDPPATTGDAAIYATIAVAVAAVALAVVFKRRTTI